MSKEALQHTIVDMQPKAAPAEVELQPITPQPVSPELGAYLRQRSVEAQIGLLLQKTPRREIRTRLLNPRNPEGPNNPRLKYLEHAYVTETLNLCFGFNWDLEVIEQERINNEAVVRTRLTVRLADGSAITKDSFGGALYQPNNPNSSWADTLKAAQSDGLKAAAARLGIGLDLYRHEELANESTPVRGERAANNENRSPEAMEHPPGRDRRGDSWNWFWGVKVKELGLSNVEVHARLGVASVRDWTAQGKSLDEAVKALEGQPK